MKPQPVYMRPQPVYKKPISISLITGILLLLLLLSTVAWAWYSNGILDKLNNVNSALSQEKNAHNVTVRELQDTQSKLYGIRLSLNATQQLLDVNNTLPNPTYAEFRSFYENDSTHNHPYVNDTYVCINFAHDFRMNATKHRIRCAYVWVNYNTTGHALNAVNTIDKGIVYIEPQTNKELGAPVVGSSYENSSEPVTTWASIW